MNERALDELVAEKVLGWRRDGKRWFPPDALPDASINPEAVRPLPRFSSDVGAAWLLADLIGDQGFSLQLSGKKLWQARFFKSVAHTLETREMAATGGSPAEAICLAALLVLGIPTPR